jgi:hypothetical protein
MSCTFPGMDPFFEHDENWTTFQSAFVTCLNHALHSALPDHYVNKVQQRPYTANNGELEKYVDIRRRNDNMLVTLLDVVSPANKTTTAGRQAYLQTRQEATAVGASLVEVDLVLQGRPMLEYCREGLPPWDYAVTVTRAVAPDRHEIYTATLQNRLPRFRVPLGPKERDIVLDLHQVFEKCCNTIISEGFLKTQIYHHRIAVAAYYLWQQEGCPEGRDKHYWFMAEEKVRLEMGASS